ncbi:hypothetical protein [Microseira wollei]|uniref:Uncharacterized protein n=1 Tax=Microseira wollei NIES-4236 TaxID=2530354 RepID=A0AAV3XBE0_9CYAN|nr:hypothetical protein [Microseira wollei]GET37420.1 hypothetical protein MiSe_21730 [Microseira wollei NIES-4236]
MAGKVIDDSASGVLILIIPFALAIVLLFTAWPLLLVLVLLGGALNVWQRYQWLKWSLQLNPIFHQLIQANQGCLTALDLAMKANISGTAAKRFLDAKAKEFGIRAIEYEDKGTVYYFTTGSTLNSLLDGSETRKEIPLRRSITAEQMPVAVAPETVASVGEISTTAEQMPVAVAPETVASVGEISTTAEQMPVAVPPETVASVGEISTTAEQMPVAVPPETVASVGEISTTAEQMPVAAPGETVAREAEPLTAEADTPTEAQTEAPPPEQQPTEYDDQEELEPLVAEKSPKKLMAFGSLIQIELANRLGVHSSTVYKRRYDSDFPEWSKSRDPQGIAWEYSEDTKEFYPVETK